MKYIGILGLLVTLLALATATPVMAAPNENASHLAYCAVTMGGEHVAECAQNMALGVSECAQLKGPGLCDHD
ncbi:MAG: hypothetical protein A2Z02_04765 [Chloroflexi bacterium RBG_16_48_7]|nr:MAG: hypothetical protein A2Z02_04765 [Chloroflexi bacterium RBG_16_48_7]